eukprot:559608-Pelagomonas_calceolata.AAC.10
MLARTTLSAKEAQRLLSRDQSCSTEYLNAPCWPPAQAQLHRLKNTHVFKATYLHIVGHQHELSLTAHCGYEGLPLVGDDADDLQVICTRAGKHSWMPYKRRKSLGPWGTKGFHSCLFKSRVPDLPSRKKERVNTRGYMRANRCPAVIYAVIHEQHAWELHSHVYGWPQPHTFAKTGYRFLANVCGHGWPKRHHEDPEKGK